jgi:hypothetical protein
VGKIGREVGREVGKGVAWEAAVFVAGGARVGRPLALTLLEFDFRALYRFFVALINVILINLNVN